VRRSLAFPRGAWERCPGDRQITFPVTLEPDWYLEYHGSGAVRVFDPNGHTKLTARPDRPPPTLRKGSNEVRFFCDQGEGKGESVEVTLITRGEPLR
jgi:hypothetical protein